jgi:hypothetical protein
LHHIGDFSLPIAGLKSFLEEEATNQDPFESLLINEWVDRAEGLGLYSDLAATFRLVDGMGILSFPKLLKTVH